MSGQGKLTSNNTEEAALEHRRHILSEAIQRHQQDLLTGIRVYLWKLGVVRDRAELEEHSKYILQETVVQALENLRNYDPTRPARTWLLGVAINEIRHLKRKLNLERRLIHPVADTLEVQKASTAAAPSKLSEADMFDLLYNSSGATASRHTLEEILSVAGENDRKVLHLHFVEGLSGSELGTALGISEGCAYVRLSRAKAHLREAFLSDSQ